MEKLKWTPVLEMDDEQTGEHTGYSAETDNPEKPFAWLSLFPDGWHVETADKGGEITTGKICKSLSSAKRWATMNPWFFLSDDDDETAEDLEPVEIMADEIRKPENLVEPRAEYAGEDLGQMWRNPDLETPVDMRRLEQLESVATCGGCPEIIGALSGYTGPDYRTPVEYPVYYFRGLGLLVVDYSTDTENDYRVFGAVKACATDAGQTAAALADTLYENFSVR